ncbi:hypothetical protein PanWU01x14_252220 [Parasponia andersonii]|uniref:Uncharacterized protein n=1 Tax=Parasponia andersonii TaxID=3476 RepID=A0A2P5BC05_PARAD|nr:hypothetical protein PanWU01x14_252220 [Parasponia andersonii]
MNLMPRMVSYLPFPLDTWVITKHLRGQLDASALNRFRRDEADRITMASRQVATSSQLAGSNDLVAPSAPELEEAVRLVAAECARLREEENIAPKRVKGSEAGPSVGTSSPKGKAAASRVRVKAPMGRRLVVHAKRTEPAAPHSDASGALPAPLASRGEAMMSAIRSFHSDRVKGLIEELNSRTALAERCKAALAELRSDFDSYQGLEEARVSSAVAHALSVEKARSEELAAKLARSEADSAAHSEAARLAQGELRIKERELQSAGAEMGLAFIARDNAIEDAKEARKAEAVAKLEAHALQRRLERSHEINRHLFTDHKSLMVARVEASRKHCADLDGINSLLLDLSQRQAELRVAALKDRLRSGWENREFENHAEVVTPDQFDDQKGVERDNYSIRHYMQQLENEITIIYPADVLEMLAAEKDGPSTSAPDATVITPAAHPPGQTSEPQVVRPDPEASLGEGLGAVVVSSDESNPATPLSPAAGPSAGEVCPSPD